MSPGPLAARVATLEALYREVQATRMAGVPVLHPGLEVAATGFAPDGEGGALGVLVTPWFMNLVWFGLGAGQEAPLAPGASRVRAVGPERLDFIGAFEPGFGAFEACSLYSPMFEFQDQAAALATAREVLALLRPARPAPPAPARRAFLFGGAPR